MADLTSGSSIASSEGPATPMDVTMADSATLQTEDRKDGVDQKGVKEGEPAPPQRINRLKYLLQQSQIYSSIIGQKMEREREERRLQTEKAERKGERTKAKEAAASADVVESEKAGPSTRSGAGVKGTGAEGDKKRRTLGRKRKEEELEIVDLLDEKDLSTSPAKKKAKRASTDGAGIGTGTGTSTNTAPSENARQPALVSGAKLRDYQLAGMEWLTTLYENGLNGILADEMGLGKTLQTISFLAYLRERGVWGPFLIVCPLSTVANWVNEFERFTPTIPVLLYHGTPQERAKLRAERLSPPSSDTKSKGRHSMPAKGAAGVKKNTTETFPIVVTSYELVMNDRKYLNKYQWKFIVVDESHRLKNLECKLIRELKSYKSANRLLLTGTPLHNDLRELWSLLNFILPDIFDDIDSFQQWFDFSDIHSEQGHQRIISSEQSTHIVTNLHSILKPFLLRRLKADVEKDLPPKKEYLLSAPLTQQQKSLYDTILNRQLREHLINLKGGGGDGDDEEEEAPESAESEEEDEDEPMTATSSSPSKDKRAAAEKMGTRKQSRKDYTEMTDAAFTRHVESGAYREEQLDKQNVQDPRSAVEIGKAYAKKAATQKVNNMRLQNVVMQLRKVCNHPWLFDWPVNSQTGEEVVNEDLVNASGKMLLLNRLLAELFKRGHKVLIFSQFTSMLNIIEDWAVQYKKWEICRIDGNTKQEDRRLQMKRFNEEKGEDAPNLFLLSTRSGGVGINLVAADTVILFDSDWNPQMDLQAMDRAHRIGQTKPVLVFRLVSGNTVENTILIRASAKRKLEALVIGKDNFKLPGAEAANIINGKKPKGQSTVADLAEVLFRQEEDKIVLAGKDDEIISQDQLNTLLDRSDEAMNRKTGWHSKTGDPSAFEVYETQRDETSDVLAKMLQQDQE